LICRPKVEEDTAGAGAVDFKREEVFHMPRFDGTGPAGMGPMTGWGRGYCNTSQTTYGSAPAWGPGYWGAVYGSGFGRGRGFSQSRGFDRGFWPGTGRGRGYGRGFGWRGAYPARGGW
jgi:hypothetical protein